VRLAGEALDQLHRAEGFVQPAEQLGLQFLHTLFAVDQRPRVVAQAHVHERDDGERQQSDVHVQAQQDGEHHRQRRDRRRQREEAAHHEVLDRVRVDVDAVDGVGRARRDVMVEAERGQMREQLAAQVVDHPLAGVDLHLRVDCRHHLRAELQQEAAEIITENKGDPSLSRFVFPFGSRENALIQDSDVQFYLDQLTKKGDIEAGQVRPADVYTNEFNPASSG